MGQYWLVCNLDKHEFIDPHKLGVGLKLGEQVGSGHGTPDALFILVAAMRERRGGGDFDWDSNYYGPERDMSKPGHNIDGAPVVEEYNTVAKRTIGRWAGDRVAVVGDYAEDTDLPKKDKASQILKMCYASQSPDDDPDVKSDWVDVSEDVRRVIEHECGGTFSGTGWRTWTSKWRK
ncbi:MAG TPA: hypothetical protein VEP90_16900 [Methylomirabilota bacterium]|nr:hypothetical protein [Methylomirabilota bacterium]